MTTYQTKVMIPDYPAPSKDLIEDLRRTPSADSLRGQKTKYRVKAGPNGEIHCPGCDAELIVTPQEAREANQTC